MDNTCNDLYLRPFIEGIIEKFQAYENKKREPRFIQHFV